MIKRKNNNYNVEQHEQQTTNTNDQKSSLAIHVFTSK